MVEIIAEFGSSPAPEWDFDKWCHAAATAGATHAKCQMFRAEHFPAPEWASKRPLEFPRHRLSEFVAAAHACGLKAGVSVFDAEAVELAAKHCDFLKMAAREQGNWELCQRALDSGKTVYRSISSMDYLIPNVWLWLGGSSKQGKIIALFTRQQYPVWLLDGLSDAIYAAAIMNINHRSAWGYSSHSMHGTDCWLAAKLGAAVIEKHLALSPDDIEAGHSLLPDAFRRMTRAING